MSKKLIEFAKSFVKSNIDAKQFAEPYIFMWQNERDSKKLGIDGEEVDEASSTIFCLADCFNPESDREDYEFDEVGLRKEVKATLDKFHLL